jgi:phosphate-selective porin OprO/OprP
MLATVFLGCLKAHAGNDSAVAPVSDARPSTATGLLLGKFTGETAYDRIWSAATLYKDGDNPILQEFSLQGILQLQYADGDSDGSFDIEDFKNGSAVNRQTVWGDRFEARRSRFGFKSKWYRHWKFEGQIDANTNQGFSNIYRDIYGLHITYAQSDAFNVTVGKTKLKFSREQEISSKDIVTVERSLLANLLFPGELTGIVANGKGIYDYWLYELGVYGSERAQAFTGFDQGTVVLGKIGYDYSSQVGLDTAVVSFQYMHNSEPGYKGNNSAPEFYALASPSFTDCIGLTNDITKGRFGFTTDILLGLGFDGTAEQAGASKVINQDDVFGISLIPTYFVADDLQLVGRFQWATGGDAGPGISNLGLPNRYEKWAPGVIQDGESYTSFYFGVNYQLYGNKLKLMTGLEYSIMDGGLADAPKNRVNDFDGYTFFSGLRFYF